MTIRTARTGADLAFLTAHDTHIAPTELANSVSLGRVLIAEQDGTPIAWLRYNLFWNNTPFMNLLYVLEPWRGQGIGRALVQHWENTLREQGFDLVMTSTASDEYAQHFYVRLGYAAAGGFTPPGEPYELIFCKTL